MMKSLLVIFVWFSFVLLQRLSQTTTAACNVKNCKACKAGDSSTCITCSYDFILTQNVCKLNLNKLSKPPCNIENCFECSDESSELCFNCQNGYYLKDYKCVLNTDTGPSLTTNKCTVSNCVSCSITSTSSCLKCSKDYYLFNQKCFLRINGKENPCYAPNCNYCRENSDLMCDDCAVGFILTNGDCSFNLAEFNQAIDHNTCYKENCEICMDADPNKCSVCSRGYYIDNYTCFRKYNDKSQIENLIDAKDSLVRYIGLIVSSIFVFIIVFVIVIIIYCYWRHKKDQELKKIRDERKITTIEAEEKSSNVLDYNKIELDSPKKQRKVSNDDHLIITPSSSVLDHTSSKNIGHIANYQSGSLDNSISVDLGTREGHVFKAQIIEFNVKN